VSAFTVVYDACVLYPPSVRDLLVELARTGLCRAKWTRRIHEEWIGAVMIGRADAERARFERIAALMNAAVLDCEVTGYEALEPTLALPDPQDRHVLGAAIRAGAQEIVTFNLRDFPESALRAYGISAVHPDVFVEHLLDLNAEAVCDAVRRIRRRLAAPPMTAEQLLATYESRGLAISASILRGYVQSL
jgi:hypothetical protein